MRKIVLYPDVTLRQKTEKVVEVDNELIDEIKEMKEILKSREIGAGLAAPQVGILKRFFVLKDLETKELKSYINPRITDTFGKEPSFVVIIDDDGKKQDFLDGCLSIPNFWGTDKRFLKIAGKWHEIEDGKLVEKEGVMEGFDAIVFQHELDHLDGVLFIDRVKQDGGKFFKQIGEEMVPWSIDKLVEMENTKLETGNKK